MTFISLTQACRQLGIDAKTLHRWLAHAQLSLQPHPHDARLKGLSLEHLQHVATAHHRRLLDRPEVASPPLADPPLSLPADLLALPQTLGALQAQLSALQQQVAEISDLIQHAVVPSSSAGDGPILPEEAGVSPATVSAPKPPAKPAHVLPLVEYGAEGHYVVIGPQNGVLPVEPESPQWFAWLATQTSFRFVGKLGRFTAHREVERVAGVSWRAHRRIRNHTYNRHLGPTEALTVAILEQAAADFQAHLV